MLLDKLDLSVSVRKYFTLWMLLDKLDLSVSLVTVHKYFKLLIILDLSLPNLRLYKLLDKHSTNSQLFHAIGREID